MGRTQEESTFPVALVRTGINILGASIDGQQTWLVVDLDPAVDATLEPCRLDIGRWWQGVAQPANHADTVIVAHDLHFGAGVRVGLAPNGALVHITHVGQVQQVVQD